MADSDGEGANKPVAYVIGQDLADMSIDELEWLIGLLREEIGRLEAARGAKSQSLSAADALFRK